MHKTLHSQRGMTLIGWIFTLVCVGFIALVIVRALPLYIEDYKVGAAIASMRNQSKTQPLTSPEEVRKGLIKRLFYVDDVTNFKEKDIKIKRETGSFRILIDYEARVLLFYNVYLLIAFSHNESVQAFNG